MHREIGARTQSSVFALLCATVRNSNISSLKYMCKRKLYRYVLRTVILLDFKRIERRGRRSTGQSKGWSSTDQGLGVKQLVPSEHHLTEVQLIQYDLCNTHEHFFPFYPTVIAPHRHLKYHAIYDNRIIIKCVYKLRLKIFTIVLDVPVIYSLDSFP